MPIISEFLSTPSARRATESVDATVEAIKFLSTPSARRATFVIFVITPFGIFLSTPSARRATRELLKYTNQATNFYPRPPRGGRPSSPVMFAALNADFYPRPPRGGRRHESLVRVVVLLISIHALREEGDRGRKG